MVENNRKKHGLETQEGVPVRETWFQGHFDGNLLFPQKLRVIRIYEASAILTDPPDNWQELRNSHLTARQIGIASMHMNVSHDREQIPRFTADYRRKKAGSLPASTIVPPTRFNDLWKSGADGVLRMVLQKVDDGQPLPAREAINMGQVSMISEDEVEKINNFWHDPKNKAKKAHMREAARVIYQFFQTPKGENYMKLLSDLWKSSISRRLTEDQLKEYLTSDLTRKYLTLKHGRYDSDAVLPFLTKLDALKHRPTDMDANEDIIFQEARDAIQVELGEQGYDLPFGLKFESKPAA